MLVRDGAQERNPLRTCRASVESICGCGWPIDKRDCQFPDRTRLLKFVRQVTGKSDKAAQELLDQVRQGVEVARQHADRYGRKHVDAAQFVERLSAVMKEGMARLRLPKQG
jgi:hypothetical protein